MFLLNFIFVFNLPLKVYADYNEISELNYKNDDLDALETLKSEISEISTYGMNDIRKVEIEVLSLNSSLSLEELNSNEFKYEKILSINACGSGARLNFEPGLTRSKNFTEILSSKDSTLIFDSSSEENEYNRSQYQVITISNNHELVATIFLKLKIYLSSKS